ncbi:MAG: DUF2017 domain-containing protein [Actinomycetes bacterium]
MAHAFAACDGSYATQLLPLEREMIKGLLDELCALLARDDDVDPKDLDPLAVQVGMMGLEDSPVHPPDDPVLARLLPEGYRNDPMAASEFRRYTDGALRMGKIADAGVVRAGIERADADPDGSVSVTDDEAPAWLRSINDLRLALGVKLEITDDSAQDLADIPEDDPRALAAAVYDFLTWWQDSLVRAIVGDD